MTMPGVGLRSVRARMPVSRLYVYGRGARKEAPKKKTKEAKTPEGRTTR